MILPFHPPPQSLSFYEKFNPILTFFYIKNRTFPLQPLRTLWRAIENSDSETQNTLKKNSTTSFLNSFTNARDNFDGREKFYFFPKRKRIYFLPCCIINGTQTVAFAYGVMKNIFPRFHTPSPLYFKIKRKCFFFLRDIESKF